MSASDSSSEEDFMSDAFLAKVAAPPAGSSSVSKKSSAGQTYQEKRRLARLESERKNKANATKSYREREEDARQEGMRKNLFEKELEAESGPGTAMKMMMKMGYQVGEGLGKRAAPLPVTADPQQTNDEGKGKAAVAQAASDDDEDDTSGLGGLGSRKRLKLESQNEFEKEEEQIAATASSSASQRNTSSGQRFEPIFPSLWAGRKGLGLRPPPPPPLQEEVDLAAFPAKIDPYAFRSRQQQEYEEKKAEGQLGQARKTTIELDEREERGFSILHLNPHHPPSFPPPLLAHLTGTELPPPPPSSIIGHTPVANASQAELLRLQMAQDRLAPLMAQGEDDENGDRLGLAGLKVGRERHREDAAAENTLLAQEKAAKVDGDEEEDWEVLAGEAAKFLVLPASQRLKLTLGYLRDEYNFCFYCGCAYNDADDLSQNCPGETEEDHD